jgi:L-aminopeptidase/D-esterase-like protein
MGDEFGGLGVAHHYPDPHIAMTKLASHANTTIGIVATDADLTQAQCTRMATAAHDGFARALVPAHTPMDGDLIFAAAMGTRPLGHPAQDTLALGHAAATCMARAIARAIYAAASLPADPCSPAGRIVFGHALAVCRPLHLCHEILKSLPASQPRR